MDTELDLIAQGYQYVYNPFTPISERPDSGQQYEFMRAGWDKPMVFRLADNPFMNVWGLFYRPLPQGEGVR